MSLPLTAKINADNHLEVGGCDVVALAKKYGTPLYIIDEDALRNNCRGYLTAFRDLYPNTEICFASKALCTAGIAKIIADEGLGFDVSSGGELFTVLKAGADPAKIIFHGNNKTVAEIEEGLKAEIGYFAVDNEEELTNLDKAAAKLKKQAKIIIRINPGIDAHTHEFIQTGKIDSKFGVPSDQLEDFIAKVQKKKNIKLEGFHAHIGSQILDIKPFVEEIKILLQLTEKYKTGIINIGGGLGISYLPDQKPPLLVDFAKEIINEIAGKTEAKLILEPGRSIIGATGLTVYTVGVVKDIPGIRKYVIVDGGMSDNPRPILYDAKYEALLANKAGAASEEIVTVAGRFCESGDILIKDIKLPKIAASDLLVMTCTGAYTYSMASNYNRVPRPAMVLVSKGRSSLLIKRESYKDLVINDAA